MQRVIYVTYDPVMRDFMTNQGIRYLIVGQAPNPPHKNFWVYDKTTEKFQIALQDWFANKKAN